MRWPNPCTVLSSLVGRVLVGRVLVSLFMIRNFQAEMIPAIILTMPEVPGSAASQTTPTKSWAETAT